MQSTKGPRVGPGLPGPLLGTMKRFLVLAVVLLALGARADEASADEKDVKVATDKNWDTLIKSAKYALGKT